MCVCVCVCMLAVNKWLVNVFSKKTVRMAEGRKRPGNSLAFICIIFNFILQNIV